MNVENIRLIKEAAEASLKAYPNVNGIGVGLKYVNGQRTDELCIFITVSKKMDKSMLSQDQQIPSIINGVKTDIVEFNGVPLANKLASGASYDPLVGGIDIGRLEDADPGPGALSFGGTLGCIVLDNSTGQLAALSNFHVFCGDGTFPIVVGDGISSGDRICQPSWSNAGGGFPGFGTGFDNPIFRVIGRLKKAAIPGISPASGVISANIDAAICSLLSTGFTNEIVNIGKMKPGPLVGGATAPTVGMKVRKQGARTGLTYGTIAATNFNWSLSYGGTVGSRSFTNQILIDGDLYSFIAEDFSDHGDSGSIIVNNSNQPVGLLYAGDAVIPPPGPNFFTIANPIADVFSALNIGIIWTANTGDLPSITIATQTVAYTQSLQTPAAYTPAPLVAAQNVSANQVIYVEMDSYGHPTAHSMPPAGGSISGWIEITPS